MRKARGWMILLGAAISMAVLFVCICLGSFPVPLSTTLDALGRLARGQGTGREETLLNIALLRFPRAVTAGLMGAALALCGAAMQGLLRNPLADGATLGVTSGASLGAALSILTGFTLPGFALSGRAVLAIVFAFGSLLLILSLAWTLDRSLSTQTIILTGVIFSMLASSLLTLAITFAGAKLKTITFWTLGSLVGSSWAGAGLLAGTLLVCAPLILLQAPALDVFAMGEDEAMHLGVPVRRTKTLLLAAVSALTGVCVAVGGGIAFVGLAVPHMVRLVTGPGHRRLLPASAFAGSVFLMLCDLAARTVGGRTELPIGVLTSTIGAVIFIWLMIRMRGGARR